MQYANLEQELIALGTSLSEETMTVAIEGRDINLMLDTAKTYLYAYAGLREIEEGIDKATLRSLLTLNTLGKTTEGGHLGLIEGSGTLLYSKRFLLDTLPVGKLASELKAIADTLRRLSGQTDHILQSAVIETEVAQKTDTGYDALSMTSAITFGWIRA